MKILYVSQVFPPDFGATIRVLEQAVCLQSLNHKVTVITTMGYYPLGKVHPHYRGKLYVRETMAGIDVIRVWSLPSSNRGILKRVLSQLSFAVSVFLAALMLEKPDLMIASTHIFATEMAVILLSRIKRCKSMIELRDLFPENLAFKGIRSNSLQARFLRCYFDICFKYTDFVAVLGESMIPCLLKRGIKMSQIILLPHAADRGKFENAHPARVVGEHQLQGKFLVVYAGSFSTYYDVPNILNAAAILAQTHPDIHFFLIGDGQEFQQLRNLQHQTGIVNTTLTGKVAPEDIPDYLLASELCLASLVGAKTPDFYRNLPSTKLCEYLMAGKAVLAVENVTILGDLLRHIGAGDSVVGNDPAALAQAVARLYHDRVRLNTYAQNARRYAEEHLDRKHVVARFEETLVEKMGKGQ
jgi:glycosyltransferase involved in cell wall biosynthesis